MPDSAFQVFDASSIGNFQRFYGADDVDQFGRAELGWRVGRFLIRGADQRDEYLLQYGPVGFGKWAWLISSSRVRVGSSIFTSTQRRRNAFGARARRWS